MVGRPGGRVGARPRPSERPGRCEIPDWFDPLREQTRRELEEAERRAAVNAAKRERLEAQLVAARAVRDRLEEPTRWVRERLVAAQHVLDAASRDLATAKHRLDACGIRGRRQARRELAAAENQLTLASHHLAQVQASTSPDIERYHQVWHQVRELSEARRSHAMLELVDRYTTIDRIPHLEQCLDALDTWWRFANGDSIDVDRLGEVFDTLSNVDEGRGGHYRWLADSVEQHCLDSDIHLPTLELEVPGIEPPSLDIGL